MKEYIKSYNMYIPGSNILIKLGLYVAYPIILTAIYTVAHVFFSPAMYYISLYSIVSTEIILDKFLLSGISRKDGLRTMFLRLSNTGLSYMHKALIVDVIRRGLNVVVSNVAAFIIATTMFPDGQYITVEVLIIAMVLVLFAEEVGLWIARKYDNIMITSIVAYLACSCMGILMFLDTVEIFVGENSISTITMVSHGFLFVLIVALAIVIPLRIADTKKAGKEGYYD